MNQFWTLFKQDLSHLIYSPGTLAIFLLFPTVVILLMGFLFDNLYHTSLLNSYDFYGVTIVFFVAMIGSTVPANAFLEKRLRSGNTRIFYSPVSRIHIYSSKILACFLFMSVCLTFNVVVFEMIGFVNFGHENILYVILLLMSFILFLTLLSSAICVTVHSEEITNVILSNLMSTLGFLSGIFFPIANLGVFFEKVSHFSPIRWTIDCVFQIIYDGKGINYWWIIFGLFMISVVLMLVVHKNYQPEDYI